MNGGGPYRDGDAPLYVCVACVRSASRTAGACPRCSVDRSLSSEAGVVEMLRGEVERRLGRGLEREHMAIWLGALVVAVPCSWIFAQLRDTELWLQLTIGLVAGLGLGATALVERLRASSALAIFAERKRRLRLALGEGATVVPTLAAGGDDERRLLPATAPTRVLTFVDPLRASPAELVAALAIPIE